MQVTRTNNNVNFNGIIKVRAVDNFIMVWAEDAIEHRPDVAAGQINVELIVGSILEKVFLTGKDMYRCLATKFGIRVPKELQKPPIEREQILRSNITKYLPFLQKISELQMIRQNSPIWYIRNVLQYVKEREEIGKDIEGRAIEVLYPPASNDMPYIAA
jgi:hypothetical protein